MSRSTTITTPAFILKASLAVLVLTSFCIAEGRVCIDLFAGDVGKKSEAHRIDVYSRYAQVFAKLERVRKGYQDQLQQITQIQVPQAKPVVIAGVTISAPLTLRPQIAAKTIADLTKWDPLESTCRHASLSIL